MFIRNLDYLSPPITFYHKDSLSHSSIVSGILSIISFMLIIAIAIYFSLDLINRTNPAAFYYNRYIEDSGTFPMNSSSVFHFISLSVAENGYVDNGVDFNAFRVFGIEQFFTSYLNDTNLSHFNHWLYGPCINGVNNEGISDLITQSYFEKSACIKKFFDTDKQKYFNIGEPGFRWPVMAHGTYNANSQYYAIVLERCKEETINLILGGENNHCVSDEKFDDIIGISSAAHMFYIDYYVDVLNYKNPNTKFLNRVENAIKNSIYPMNNLNFNPVLLKTHNGLVLDNIEEEEAYIYERNDVFTYESKGNGIYTVYYFWLSNNQKYYERIYKRIQDVISNIGGINQAITLIAFIINKLYNNYIVLCDTEDLLFSTIDLEKYIYKKDSNKLMASKDKKNYILKKSSERGKIFREKPTTKNDEIVNKTDSNISKSKNFSFNNNEINKSNEKMNQLNNNANKLNEIITLKSKRKKIFLNYIFFKLSFEKKNTYFKTYENLRKKILSEQHLIRNHLNIYTLLKVTKSKRLARKNSYHLNDLFQLI